MNECLKLMHELTEKKQNDKNLKIMRPLGKRQKHIFEVRALISLTAILFPCGSSLWFIY